MHETIKTLVVKHEQALIKQYVDCFSPSTIDHELSARLA